jgi:hypothetical protein
LIEDLKSSDLLARGNQTPFWSAPPGKVANEGFNTGLPSWVILP